MTDTLRTILTVVAVLLIAPIAVVYLKDRIVAWWDRKNHAKVVQAQMAEHRKRLLNPKFDEYKRFFHEEPPDFLKNLYANPELCLKEDFFLFPPQSNNIREAFEILHFLPVDIASVEEYQDFLKDRNVFPFAVDGTGSPYFIRVHQRPNWEVFLYHMDGGNIDKVCSSLNEFLSRPQVMRKDIRSS